MGAEDETKEVEDKPEVTDTLLGGTAIKPLGWDRKGWEAVKYLIYNPDTGAILTRTPLSWAKITAFYIVYYSCLAGFWAACMMIFFQTLPDHEPRWILKDSIIGVNPGLGAKPSNSDKRIDSSIYAFNQTDLNMTATNDHGEGDANADWVQRMSNFLDASGILNDKADLEDCKDNKNRAVEEGEDKLLNCKFDITQLDVCQTAPYGYVGEKIEPCIFLKFNKIFNWVPTVVKEADLNKKPYETMPEGLKTHIREEEDKNHVWVDCHGRYPADKEALEGNMDYFPSNKGIAVKYFPFQGKTQDYGVPLVAVKFRNIPVGQIIHVECKAWFEGVVHSSRDKEGLTQFEIFIEK
jgi:sodium/potassium-transporting ATPase subunit beta